MAKNHNPTNHLRLPDSGAFILPSMVGALPTGLIQSPNERQSLPERDGTRFCSLGTIPAGEMHEKTLRLRRERLARISHTVRCIEAANQRN